MRSVERGPADEKCGRKARASQRRTHDLDVRPQVVVERECDGEPITGAAFECRVEEPGRRDDTIRRAQVIQLRFEQASAKPRDELVARVSWGIPDAVVHERDGCLCWRAAFEPCSDISAEANLHLLTARTETSIENRASSVSSSWMVNSSFAKPARNAIAANTFP